MALNYEVKEKSLSIVIVGGFSPLNFTHDWLYNYELISESDYKASSVEAISVSHVVTSLPWATINVVPANSKKQKLTMSLVDEGSIAIFIDLVHSIIEMNYTSMMTAIGINFNRIIQHKNVEDWHKFGNKLVPKPIWQKAFTDSDVHCGTASVAIQIDSILEPVVKLENNKLNELNITVRPLPFDEENGLNNATEVSTNYHFPLNPDNCAEQAKKTLERYFEDLYSSVDERIKTLITDESNE